MKEPQTVGELAAYLARSIFAAGDQAHDKVQRIEFKGGSYPDNETPLGGFNETGLANEIEEALARIARPASGGT